MRKAWLRKYPRVPGAGRFVAYFVQVEILAERNKTTEIPVYEFVDDPEESANRGIRFQRRIQVGTKPFTEEGFTIREKGRDKWVPGASIFMARPV